MGELERIHQKIKALEKIKADLANLGKDYHLEQAIIFINSSIRDAEIDVSAELYRQYKEDKIRVVE